MQQFMPQELRSMRRLQWVSTGRSAQGSWKYVVIEIHQLGVFGNRGTPQIIHFNGVFHYKPSICGYPPLMETTMLPSPDSLAAMPPTKNFKKCWVLLWNSRCSGPTTRMWPLFPSNDSTTGLQVCLYLKFDGTQHMVWDIPDLMSVYFSIVLLKKIPLGFRKSEHNEETSLETGHQWLGFGYSFTTDPRQCAGQPTSMV